MAPRRALGGKATVRWLALAGWAGLVGVGLAAQLRHDFTPGPAVAMPARLPDDLRASLGLAASGADRPLLLLVAHPHCPCTVATVELLDSILGSAGQPPDLVVLLLAPAPAAGADAWAWRDGRAARRAAELRGARLVADPGGVLAARLGATTSGTVLVFGPDGQRRFAGGLTAARGQLAEGPGATTLRALLARPAAVAAATAAPVFGCALGPPGTDPGGVNR